jgi:predicted small secreted protein
MEVKMKRSLIMKLGLIGLVIATVLAFAMFLTGCETGYKIIYGPANLTLGATPVTPGVSVQIEENGVAWFGEDKPSAEELGYLTATGTEDEE